MARWAVLSARIGGLACGGGRVGVQAGDDVVEVDQDLLVHLDQPLVASGLGGGDDLEDLSAVLVVLVVPCGAGGTPLGGAVFRLRAGAAVD